MRATTLLLLAAAACGDNTVPAATVDAHPPVTLDFQPCPAGTLQCATLTVPADYSQPAGATIQLKVVRAPARDPARRIGVLTFNFGGPGAGTLDPIANGYPYGPLATGVDLSQQFDWVLMDWRGVATTTPLLTCLDSSTAPRLGAERFAPATDQAWTDLFQLVADISAGCSANTANAPLLAHMDTESTARDFDALRVALGEAKLNMWVVSYGTRLGSMYATLFPDHVRAIALDSPMLPVPQLETDLDAQNANFEIALSHFFAWCATAAAADCPFQTGDGLAASVSAKYEQLLTAADTAPVVAQGVTLDRPTINSAAIGAMYFPLGQWPELGKALGALAGGNGKPMAVVYAENVIDGASDDNAFSAYQQVSAQDEPLPADVSTQATYRAWAEAQDAVAPHVGLQNIAAQAFALDWPATAVTEHAIGPTTAPPLLITASRFDPATAYEWAGELQAAFANGSYLVTYEGDGHANAGGQVCLGDVTAAFLLDPTTSPATTDCPIVAPGASAHAAVPAMVQRLVNVRRRWHH